VEPHRPRALLSAGSSTRRYAIADRRRSRTGFRGSDRSGVRDAATQTQTAHRPLTRRDTRSLQDQAVLSPRTAVHDLHFAMISLQFAVANSSGRCGFNPRLCFFPTHSCPGLWRRGAVEKCGCRPIYLGPAPSLTTKSGTCPPSAAKGRRATARLY